MENNCITTYLRRRDTHLIDGSNDIVIEIGGPHLNARTYLRTNTTSDNYR